jgi:hypothetical protein
MGSHTSKTEQSSSNSRLRVPKYDLNHFGVITVLFNPMKYKSRYELYHKFDEHMSRSGVTLLTVECIFESDEGSDLPRQKFEITRPNDPRHLQIKAPSVIWLKENLINIAVKRLPSYVEYVAWLDADIEFEVSFIFDDFFYSNKRKHFCLTNKCIDCRRNKHVCNRNEIFMICLCKLDKDLFLLMIELFICSVWIGLI